MSETTIEWCHYTFNPWIGCAKVSQACRSCYASVDTFARASRARMLLTALLALGFTPEAWDADGPLSDLVEARRG